MEEWERNLDAALDELAETFDVVDVELERVGSEAPSLQLSEYAKQLANRWSRLRTPVNEVIELPGAIYSIRNYDYNMFCWFMERHFKAAVMTSYSINIPQGELTPEERKQFQERLH